MTDLEKHFPKYPVGLIAEDCAEDNRYPVMASFDVYRFFISVLNRSNVTTLKHSLRRLFGSVFGSFLLQGVELIEGLLEWGRHDIALQQRDAVY